MTENKKSRERHLLDEFATIYPAFPAGEVVDHESPDFLVKDGSRITGIEIVDYIRGQHKGVSEERRNEDVWQRVANKAKEIFEVEHNNIPLVVHFLWKPRYLLRKAEIPQLATTAFSMIENHIPRQPFEIVRIGSDEFEDTLLEKVCHSIIVCRVEKQSLWSFLSSGWIEVQINEIQFLLDSKNGKVNKYLQACDTVWLLIVADGSFISSNVEISSTVANHIYLSSFEQVFIYSRISKIVLPLMLQQL